jgi:hypothetical protein
LAVILVTLLSVESPQAAHQSSSIYQHMAAVMTAYSMLQRPSHNL